MVLLDMLMVFICIAALSTLRMMRGIFPRLERMVYYMAIVVAIERLHSAIVDNFKLIKLMLCFAIWMFHLIRKTASPKQPKTRKKRMVPSFDKNIGYG